MNDTVAIRTEISPIDLDAMTHPEGYVMEDNDLRAAANAALILGKPLLLTGEAGVGKSQFANWLAHQLGVGRCRKFVVKSTTEARDLFYQYDALARFHSAQIARAIEGDAGEGDTAAFETDSLRYITYNALGQAILLSMGQDEAMEQGFVTDAMWQGWHGDAAPTDPRRSVVLVDEIDKAPRDVPNDILDEIDSLSFTVRELENRVARANKALRPVVVITSNSERDLPKPFLRRCVFYHMGFPSDEALARIVDNRIGHRFEVGDDLRGQAIGFFRYLKDEAGLRQPPGLAELIDWLYSLHFDRDASGLRDRPDLSAITKSTLLKDRHDQEEWDRSWRAWLDEVLGPAERAVG